LKGASWPLCALRVLGRLKRGPIPLPKPRERRDREESGKLMSPLGSWTVASATNNYTCR